MMIQKYVFFYIYSNLLYYILYTYISIHLYNLIKTYQECRLYNCTIFFPLFFLLLSHIRPFRLINILHYPNN